MDQQLPEKPSNQSPTHSSVQRPLTVTDTHQPSLIIPGVLAGCLLSAIVIIVVSVAGITFAKNWFKELICDLPVLHLCDNGPDIVVGPPTIDEIRALGWLESLEVDFATTVKVTNRRGTWPFETDEILIYNVCGCATAGVDLEKLEEQDVKISKKVIGDVIMYTITMTLPQAEVLAVNPADGTSITEPVLKVPAIPEYSLEDDNKAEILLACNKDIVWDVPFGYDPTPSLVRDAEEQALIQFRAFAEEGYVLELAQQNAKRELERFLKLAGYKNVIFAEPIESEEPANPLENVFESLMQPLQDLNEVVTPQPED
jgi:hypothetical protein